MRIFTIHYFILYSLFYTLNALSLQYCIKDLQRFRHRPVWTDNLNPTSQTYKNQNENPYIDLTLIGKTPDSLNGARMSLKIVVDVSLIRYLPSSGYFEALKILYPWIELGAYIISYSRYDIDTSRLLNKETRLRT